MKKRDFIKHSALSLGGLISGGSLYKIIGSSKSHVNALSLSKDELWKWSKKAYYFTATARGPKCDLCPNNCILEEGETGDCRNRVNYQGTLYSIGYGNPCAVHVDPIEKKPLYHFLPASKAFSIATAGCNLACMNCQNWNISQKSPKKTRNYDLMPSSLVNSAIEHECQSLAYTYTEPITFYEYMFDSARIAHENNIKNVMITAGYIHEKPLRDLCKHIDAANVDLKSFSNQTYIKLNAGTIKPVLRTLQIMKEEGVWLEITNLVVPEWTDDLEMIKKMCVWLYQNGFKDTPLHFSRFHPTYKLSRLPATPVTTLKKARQIAQDAGLRYVYIGNVPDSGAEDTVCPNCGKTIIKRRGFYIQQNNLQNNACPDCNQKIAGFWDS